MTGLHSVLTVKLKNYRLWIAFYFF